MSDWTTVAGVQLEMVERGRGRPILWLHGEEGLDPDAPVLGALAAHGRLLAPSHPGYGHSPEAATVDTVDDLQPHAVHAHPAALRHVGRHSRFGL